MTPLRRRPVTARAVTPGPPECRRSRARRRPFGPVRTLLTLMAIAVACTQPSAGGARRTQTTAPPAKSGAGASTTAGSPGKADRGPGAASACELPEAFRVRIERGYVAGRSGDIELVPRYPDYFSGYSHFGPWKYLQNVPLALYGPGYIRQGVTIDTPVTSASIAPTLARLIGFADPGWHPDGAPLAGAIDPGSSGRPKPRLVVVVVWDAGGIDVLKTWPDAWPNLKALMANGASYTNAIVGSSPSSTPPIHATIGTGVFPRRHGMVDIDFRHGGTFEDSWAEGPKALEAPTLADMYDGSDGPYGTKPKIALVGTDPWHLGLIGHGSYPPGSGRDRDIALMKMPSRPLPDWSVPPPSGQYFAYARYVEGVGGLAEDARRMDADDGATDGTWRGQSLQTSEGVFDSPARIPYETRVVHSVIQHEGFGADDVPDLFFVNLKIIDLVEHIWSMNSPQMEDAVRWTDGGLPQLIGYLNDLVGRGKWVMVVTADHGSTPDSRVSGAFVVKRDRLEQDIDDRFGRGVVVRATATQLWVDPGRLAQAGHTLEDVTRFLLGYTERQNGASTHPDRHVFQAVFPSSLMPLTCPS